MMKFFLIAAAAALPLAGGFGATVPQPPASSPAVLHFLKTQGLTVDSRFTAIGGLTGYVGTTPDGHHIVFYVPADGSVAIFGTLIDAYGHNLTQAYGRRFIQKPENQKNYGKLAARNWIAEGDANPRRIVYAFIDPNCPYCWQFWEAARKVSGVQVRYLMVGILGQSSISKAAAILAAKDPRRALTENEIGFRYHEGAITPLASVPGPLMREITDNNDLMKSFGFDGTPGLIWQTESGEVEISNGLPDAREMSSIFGTGDTNLQPQTPGKPSHNNLE